MQYRFWATEASIWYKSKIADFSDETHGPFYCQMLDLGHLKSISLIYL